MHPKDSRYLLRDDFYKYVQKDWPGYSDSERQQISRMLARWVSGSGEPVGPPQLMSLWVQNNSSSSGSSAFLASGILLQPHSFSLVKF